MSLYLYNLLIGLDQFANVIFGGAPDMTISSRCWLHRDCWAGALAVRFIDWLFSWREADHCRMSCESGDRQTTESIG